MSDSAVSHFTDFLNSHQQPYACVGTQSDRERYVRFTRGEHRYELNCEFPVLPCLFVFNAATGVRIDDLCVTTQSTPAVTDVAQKYYRHIESLRDSELDKLRYADTLDRWIVPVIAAYTEVLIKRWAGR